jgi:hypothetical protein
MEILPQGYSHVFKCNNVAFAIGGGLKCEMVIQPIFPLLKKINWIVLNFPWKKLLKIQYLLHLRYKKFQITFIASYSLKFFNNTEKVPKFPHNFSFDINRFSMKILFNIQ